VIFVETKTWGKGGGVKSEVNKSREFWDISSGGTHVLTSRCSEKKLKGQWCYRVFLVKNWGGGQKVRDIFRRHNSNGGGGGGGGGVWFGTGGEKNQRSCLK